MVTDFAHFVQQLEEVAEDPAAAASARCSRSPRRRRRRLRSTPTPRARRARARARRRAVARLPRRVPALMMGHAAPLRAVAVLPDGSGALAGGDDRAARLWSLTTGEVARTFRAR